MRRLLVTAVAIVGIVVAVKCRHDPQGDSVTPSPALEHELPGASTLLERAQVSPVAEPPSSERASVTLPSAERKAAPEKPIQALSLRGRLVDELGRPLESNGLEARAHHVPPHTSCSVSIQGANIEVAQGGWFTCIIQFRVPAPDKFEFVVGRLGADASQTMRGSFLVNDTHVAELDVGDLVMRAPPVLLAGRVVDPEGKGLRAWVGYDDARPRHCDYQWFSAHRATYSAPDGSFTLLGWSTATNVAARASDGMHDDARVEGVAPGTRDLVLRLRPSTRGSMEVRLEVDDVDMLRFIEVFVLDSLDRESSECSPWASAGTCRFDGLLPGEYRLRVQLRPMQFDLVDLVSLEVPTRGACADVRLQPVDLRGRLRWFRGTAVRDNGLPGGFAHVPFRCSTIQRNSVISTADGRWSFLAPTEGPAVEMIHADGTGEPLRDGLVVRLR